VTGRLLGPGGTPLDDGVVETERFYPGAVKERSSLANQAYVLYLEAGTYDFVAIPAPAYPGIPAVRFRGIPIASDTTIDFPLEGHPVDGTVTGDLGAPLGDTSVSADGILAYAATRTGPDGRYRLYLPTGNYVVQVRPGFTNRNTLARRYGSVAVGAPSTLDFDLSGTRWTGTVRSTMDGSPLASVDVSARELGTGFEAGATSGPSGNFLLVLRPYSTYDILLSSGIVGVVQRTIVGVPAANDSTFDLYVEPAPPVAP
jgi:hypothetical protein